MGQNSSSIEWTIENFSCWSSQIHGNMILFHQIDASVPSEEKRFLELFPRGASGTSDHLVVNIHTLWFLGECELSFIDPSGSIIHSELRIVDEYSFETFIGPVFDRVIGRIQENDRLRKDSLTLRFRMKSSSFNLVRHVGTVIEVFNTSLTLSCDIFKDFGSNKGKRDCFSKFQYPYPLSDNRGEFLDFSLITDFSLSSIFKLLSSSNTPEKTLAKISISFSNSDRDVTKYGDFEHLISVGTSDLINMPIKDIPAEADAMLLQLKVIKNNIHNIYAYTSYYPSATGYTFTNTTQNPGDSSGTVSAGDTSADVLSNEMMSLFQDQDFSDIQLHCGPFSFAVHKGILSTRSPVFKSMLTSDMRERESNSVDIEDLEGPTLACFLAFLYSGKVDNVQWERAIKLYYAADKYQVPTLKRECVTVLCDEVSIANVCEILSLADKHQDDELTSVAHDFLLKNYNDVLKSEEWTDFMTADPALLLKTVTLFAQMDYIGKVKAP